MAKGNKINVYLPDVTHDDVCMPGEWVLGIAVDRDVCAEAYFTQSLYVPHFSLNPEQGDKNGTVSLETGHPIPSKRRLRFVCQTLPQQMAWVQDQCLKMCPLRYRPESNRKI